MNLKPYKDFPVDKPVLLPSFSITDCRSEEGITVGLIDSIITICRVLKPRIDKISSNAIKEALKDLHADSDVQSVCRTTIEEQEAKLQKLIQLKKELFSAHPDV